VLYEEMRNKRWSESAGHAAVAWAKTNTKFIPTRPCAKAQFDKDASIRDVLNQ
jgi:hypothetical protein